METRIPYGSKKQKKLWFAEQSKNLRKPITASEVFENCCPLCNRNIKGIEVCRNCGAEIADYLIAD